MSRIGALTNENATAQALLRPSPLFAIYQFSHAHASPTPVDDPPSRACPIPHFELLGLLLLDKTRRGRREHTKIDRTLDGWMGWDGRMTQSREHAHAHAHVAGSAAPPLPPVSRSRDSQLKLKCRTENRTERALPIITSMSIKGRLMGFCGAADEISPDSHHCRMHPLESQIRRV